MLAEIQNRESTVCIIKEGTGATSDEIGGNRNLSTRACRQKSRKY